MTELCDLARKFGTDKGGSHHSYGSGRCHNYTPTYYDHWVHRREEALTILEVGVEDGRSLQMWHEFFPNAMVYGWDIECGRYAYAAEPRIEIMTVPLGRWQDWVVTEADLIPPLAALVSMGNPLFDLIVDDGSHCDAQQQLAVDALLPSLKPGGIFYIEDNDTLQGGDVFVKIPEGYSLEILCKGIPHADSLLQVIRHV